jgi:uncharacterized protein YukE
MGMDVDVVEDAGRQLKSQAASIGSLISQLDTVVNALPSVWDGQDAQQFVHTWWPQHKKALAAAQQQIDGLAQSALNNASEQREASSTGGSDRGSTAASGAPGGSTGAGGLPNPGNLYRDVMAQTPIWPINVGTALGMTPLGSVTPYTDATALALNDNLSWGDKMGEQAHAFVDVGGGELRQAGWDQHNLPLYLSGVAVSQWGDVANAVSQTDFSANTFQQNMDYIASNPGDAWKAATGAVAGYVPKLVSNWTFNPFGK